MDLYVKKERDVLAIKVDRDNLTWLPLPPDTNVEDAVELIGQTLFYVLLSAPDKAFGCVRDNAMTRATLRLLYKKVHVLDDGSVIYRPRNK